MLINKSNTIQLKQTEAIKHFTQLRAWQKNHEVALSVYKITRVFPDDERFGLTNQIRRSASSVTANIAEGFGRANKGDKNRFYQIARGSSTETQNHLILAKDLGYLDQENFARIKVLIWGGYQLLNGLIASSMKNLTY
ncbi:MAG: four helix bundle protein [Patescibacteria group bacterium]